MQNLKKNSIFEEINICKRMLIKLKAIFSLSFETLFLLLVHVYKFSSLLDLEC